LMSQTVGISDHEHKLQALILECTTGTPYPLLHPFQLPC
jgi:hypothetical protein